MSRPWRDSPWSPWRGRCFASCWIRFASCCPRHPSCETGPSPTSLSLLGSPSWPPSSLLRVDSVRVVRTRWVGGITSCVFRKSSLPSSRPADQPLVAGARPTAQGLAPKRARTLDVTNATRGVFAGRRGRSRGSEHQGGGLWEGHGNARPSAPERLLCSCRLPLG